MHSASILLIRSSVFGPFHAYDCLFCLDFGCGLLGFGSYNIGNKHISTIKSKSSIFNPIFTIIFVQDILSGTEVCLLDQNPYQNLPISTHSTYNWKRFLSPRRHRYKPRQKKSSQDGQRTQCT